MATEAEVKIEHTPGPWEWFGNASSNHVYLATTHSGRQYVMDFTRWGMRGAQPRFQPSSRKGMVDAKDLLKFEVGDKSIVGIEDAKKDSSVYRYDVRGINCADARLIAAAPELLAALKAIQKVGVLNPTNSLAVHKTIEDMNNAIAKAEAGA